MKSIQYTSSIPTELMQKIDQYAGKFKIPKNRIIEEALKAYFDRMKQAEYIYSFKKASTDDDVVAMTEEGFEEYLPGIYKFLPVITPCLSPQPLPQPLSL